MGGAHVWKLEGTGGERGGNARPGPKGRHRGRPLSNQMPASSSETGSVGRADRPGVHWVEGRLQGVPVFSETPRHGWLLSQDGSRGAQLEESLSPQIWDGTGWKAPEESVSTGSRQREMGKESKCVSNPEKSAVENAPRRGPSSLTLAPNEAPPPPASCRAVRSATRRPLPGAPVPDLGLDESPARYFPLQAFGLPGPRSTQPQN